MRKRLRIPKRCLAVLLALLTVTTSLPFTALRSVQAAEKDNTSGEETSGSAEQEAKNAQPAANQDNGSTVFQTGTYTLKDENFYAGPGESAIVIQGNVTLIIEGTVNANGGGAYYKEIKSTAYVEGYGNVDYTGYVAVGAGAGIEVPAGSSLTLKGSGTLVARGGRAGDGRDGASQQDGPWGKYMPIFAAGGDGGGGAGAGIGGRGSDDALDEMQAVGSITEAWEKAKSGDYSAKLTFTIEYTNPHAKSQP